MLLIIGSLMWLRILPWPQELVTKKSIGEQILIVASSSQPLSLDPAVALDGDSFRVTINIYDTLVEHEPGGTGLRPALATNWNISENGLIYTFDLRPGIKFHDGTDFDSQAVLANFQRWQNNSLEDKYYYWQYIFGGSKDLIQEVRAVDKHQVQIVLSRPMAPLLANLAIPAFAMVSPAEIEKESQGLPVAPIGTGAFAFDSWEGDEILLVANSQYWEGRPVLDGIVFRQIYNNSNRLEALGRGEVHLIEGLEERQLREARNMNNIHILFRPSLNVGYLAMNNNIPPFDNSGVRRAINHGIDKERIIEEAFYGLAKPAHNPLPPTIWGYNYSLEPYSYNPSLARELLADSGFIQGFKATLWVMPISRPYMVSPATVGRLIKEDLAQIGVEVELKTFHWESYLERVQRGEHQMALLGWIGDHGDPDNFLSILLGQEGLVDSKAANIAFYHNPEVDRLLQAAREEPNQALRSTYYREIQELVHIDAPWVPLVHSTSPVGVSNKLLGYRPHPTGAEKLNLVTLVP